MRQFQDSQSQQSKTYYDFTREDIQQTKQDLIHAQFNDIHQLPKMNVNQLSNWGFLTSEVFHGIKRTQLQNPGSYSIACLNLDTIKKPIMQLEQKSDVKKVKRNQKPLSLAQTATLIEQNQQQQQATSDFHIRRKSCEGMIFGYSKFKNIDINEKQFEVLMHRKSRLANLLISKIYHQKPSRYIEFKQKKEREGIKKSIIISQGKTLNNEQMLDDSDQSIRQFESPGKQQPQIKKKGTHQFMVSSKRIIIDSSTSIQSPEYLKNIYTIEKFRHEQERSQMIIQKILKQSCIKSSQNCEKQDVINVRERDMQSLSLKKSISTKCNLVDQCSPKLSDSNKGILEKESNQIRPQRSQNLVKSRRIVHTRHSEQFLPQLVLSTKRSSMPIDCRNLKTEYEQQYLQELPTTIRTKRENDHTNREHLSPKFSIFLSSKQQRRDYQIVQSYITPKLQKSLFQKSGNKLL